MSRSTAVRGGAPAPDQVFVDDSGRRGRRLRWIGALFGLGCVLYVVIVLVVASPSRVAATLPAIPGGDNGAVPGFPAAAGPPGILSALPTPRSTPPTRRATVWPIAPKTKARTPSPKPLPTTPRTARTTTPHPSASRTTTAPPTTTSSTTSPRTTAPGTTNTTSAADG